MANSDFISWDDEDLNLDLLLGEYTDCDNMCNSKSIDESVQAVTLYACPECDKVLKSISGFRGHVLKKHNLNVKASEHRQTLNSTENTRTEEPKNSQRKLHPGPWIDNEIYQKIFDSAFDNALKNISESPLHNLFGKSPVSYIAEFSSLNTEFKHNVKLLFSVLASAPVNIVLSVDRESFFNKLHNIRIGKETKELCEILNKTGSPHSEEINNFLQIFLMEMTKAVLEALTNYMKKESSKACESLTENEQKVLFYIAGYILHALKKKYSTSGAREKKLKLVTTLCTETSTSKFSSMLNKKNRGGLTYPCDNFYLLIRSMERIVEEKVGKVITKLSLDRQVLSETVMEDFMVKYYVEKLFESNELTEDEASTGNEVVEDICSLFLTVRGYAMTRLKKHKLLKQEKSGNSFRSALKEKCMNKE